MWGSEDARRWPSIPAWCTHVPHLAVLLGVLLLLQAPRLSETAARLAAPVFPRDRSYVDFEQGYYVAAQRIRLQPSQLYRGTSYDDRTGQLQLTAGANFVNIPIVAWLFVPFTALPLSQAATLLLVINISITLLCLLLLQRRAARCGPLLRWGITLAVATSGPLMNALNLGQTTPLVLLLLLWAEDCLHRGRHAQAGFWFGVAGLIKIPPLLFLPYLGLRRYRRVVSAAIGVLLLATVASILCYGWALHVTYYNVVIRARLGTAIAAHNCQSLAAVVARLCTDASLTSWQPIRLDGAARLLQCLLVAAVLFACVWGAATPAGARRYFRMLLELGMIMCLSLLALPIAWEHYGIWLLPVGVIVATAVQERNDRGTSLLPWGPALLLVLAVVLINFPVLPAVIINRFANRLWFRLAISHQAFGTALLLGLCVWCLRRSALAEAASQGTESTWAYDERGA
jgi:hypothetical protein